MSRANLFTFGHYNLSVAAVKHHPKALKAELVKRLADVDVLGCCEAGQATALLHEACDEAGFVPWFGDGRPGADATPLLVREGLRIVDMDTAPLTKATRTRKTRRVAGPARVKAKSLNTVRVHFGGRTITCAEMHAPASIWWPPRAAIARPMYRRAAHELDRLNGLVVLGADNNMEWDNRILDPLDRIGLRSAQARFDLPTLRRRSPDDVRYTRDRDRMRLVGFSVEDGLSDHGFLRATFKIIPPHHKES